ncbi:hypothetical protein [Nocardia paucivorans]|uniref:hypothetical protein n=1 Tax=Nocardia paucivorans TaxID=114259 RepID=UPI0002D73A63|nr:hypothetical protein [Nocardia paucivorans]
MAFVATDPTVSTPVHVNSRTTERLLLAGAAAGPLFFVSAMAQILTREHPISQLSTGSREWGDGRYRCWSAFSEPE